MSRLIQNTVYDLAKTGARLDGRKLLERRPITIETGIVQKAEGSARVKLGKTDIIVGIKLTLGEPFSDRPDEGVLMTGAELSQIASESYEGGAPSDESIEVARVIDRVIRESQMIDLKALAIDEKRVWIVNVDLYTFDVDGNLFDAGVIAAVAALSTAKVPKLDGEAIMYGEYERDLPIRNTPASFTFAKIGDAILLDPTDIEEKMMSARLTVGVAGGKVCALQKGGPAGLTDEEILKMLQDSIKMAK